jgi:hypothetical protein
MTHSRIVMQRGGLLFHKDCLEGDPLDMEVSTTSLDKDDVCSECSDPLLVVVDEAVDSDENDDEEDD